MERRIHKMQPTKKSGTKRTAAQRLKPRPIVAEDGLVLMDSLLRVVAFDAGAAAILNPPYPTDAGAKSLMPPQVPNEIVNAIRNRDPGDLSPLTMSTRIGNSDFKCQVYVLDSQNDSFGEPMTALHLEKDYLAVDAIREIADKHHLTVREQEVLRGMSMGFATKELAARMNISPNTVKAFLRLVMIKLGVTTRAGIVAKILHNGATLNTGTGLSTATPQVRKQAV
jgi:DNA-binding CsgD family transcriptional regulator